MLGRLQGLLEQESKEVRYATGIEVVGKYVHRSRCISDLVVEISVSKSKGQRHSFSYSELADDFRMIH